MQKQTKRIAATLVLLFSMPVIGAPATDLTELHQQIEQMRREYEARINALEARLREAEKQAEQANAAASEAGKQAEQAHAVASKAEKHAEQAQVAAGEAKTEVETAPAPGGSLAQTINAFNPAISLVLQGTAINYSQNPDDWSLQGFQLGGESGLKEEGLSLDETEITLAASVDDWFYGQATLTYEDEDGESSSSVEEAYFDTLALPYGFGLRAGRFYSDIGYLNPIHSHAWDFVDAPLAYQAFLGRQYGDDGYRISWIAPTDLFLEIGAEAFRGDNFPGGDSRHDDSVLGGLHTAFIQLGGDLGLSNSWKLGLTQLYVKPEDRSYEDSAFDGRSRLTVADLVWKWAPDGNPDQRNFSFVGEFMHRSEHGDNRVKDGDSTALVDYDGKQDGFYLQGVYQFMPAWRVGLRYDRLWTDNDLGIASNPDGLDPSAVLNATGLEDGHDPHRWTAMIDFSHSEFSRLRLQYEYDQSTQKSNNAWMLQYIMTLGAHGAHQY